MRDWIAAKFVRSHLILVMAAIAFLCVSFESSAELYKYVNDSGVPVITDQLETVPQKYRARMRVIKEDIPPAQQKLLPEVERRTTDPPPSAAVQPQNTRQNENLGITAPDRNIYINTGLVLAGIVGCYFLLTRLCGSLGFPKIGMAAFLVIVLIGGVYLYNLFLKEMSSTFSDLRKDALGMKKNVETRENKTGQLLKNLPEAE